MPESIAQDSRCKMQGASTQATTKSPKQGLVLTRATLFTLALAGLAACASGPQAKGDDLGGEASAPLEPLQLTGLSVENESLQGLTLVLSGVQRLNAPASRVHWSAHVNEEELGQGTQAVSFDEEGEFRLELPLRYAEGFLIRDSNSGPPTAELVVHLSLAHEKGEATASRSVRLRRPELPKVSVQMQASRSGNNAVTLVYYFAIRNPNSFDVRASVLRYEALVASKVVSDGELPLATRIPGWADTSFDLPAEANADNVGKELRKLMSQDALDWGFRGSVKISGMEIPIDLKGDLELSR